ncbi:glutathione synthetase [Polystyrenella longa]|uniref:Glutathione synthetase n=1 Tax=Polystyrenella longa TaxID=2528007 RepID=A0A518CMP9_9PLAN|nr:hypothetical protein [Polystyrenella longa]QDU80501.1 glutathione synthetase [Polystyrenella longa]
MLLILTNSQDATADYLVPLLIDAGIPLKRLDTDTLLTDTTIAYRNGEPLLSTGPYELSPLDVVNIWYRRPEQLNNVKFSDSPEDRFALEEWAEAIEGFLAHVPTCRWMNHPSANVQASHKLEQLTTARSLGFYIPDTLVTQESAEAKKFFEQHKGQVIVKPMSGGYIEREGHNDSLIYTCRVENHHLEASSDLVNCPTLFQQFLRKRSDVRITIVDAAIHAVELYAMDSTGAQRCDIRRNNMSDVEYTQIELPKSVASSLRNLVTHYGLRFAAIDMAVDFDGKWHFLEVNPNGQWAWLDLSAGTTISNSFIRSFSHE